jgi:hypothetical protein
LAPIRRILWAAEDRHRALRHQPNILQQDGTVAATVLADYTPGVFDAEALALTTGDVITITDLSSREWWYGERGDGQKGKFPASFVALGGQGGAGAGGASGSDAASHAVVAGTFGATASAHSATTAATTPVAGATTAATTQVAGATTEQLGAVAPQPPLQQQKKSLPTSKLKQKHTSNPFLNQAKAPSVVSVGVRSSGGGECGSEMAVDVDALADALFADFGVDTSSPEKGAGALTARGRVRTLGGAALPNMLYKGSVAAGVGWQSRPGYELVRALNQAADRQIGTHGKLLTLTVSEATVEFGSASHPSADIVCAAVCCDGSSGAGGADDGSRSVVWGYLSSPTAAGGTAAFCHLFVCRTASLAADAVAVLEAAKQVATEASGFSSANPFA